MYGNMADQHGILMLPILLHPKSLGTIRLNSNDPFDKPLIDPNYLAEEQDRRILLEGIAMSTSISFLGISNVRKYQ